MAEHGGQFPAIVELDTVHLEPGDHILTDGQQPPRFAYVHVSQQNGEIAVSAAGPYSRARLEFELGGTWNADRIPSAEEVEKRAELTGAEPYVVSGFEFVGVEGTYPGGSGRMIRNAARFVLGLE